MTRQDDLKPSSIQQMACAAAGMAHGLNSAAAAGGLHSPHMARMMTNILAKPRRQPVRPIGGGLKSKDFVYRDPWHSDIRITWRRFGWAPKAERAQ